MSQLARAQLLMLLAKSRSGEAVVDGKKGVWRNIKGTDTFIPDGAGKDFLKKHFEKKRGDAPKKDVHKDNRQSQSKEIKDERRDLYPISFVPMGGWPEEIIPDKNITMKGFENDTPHSANIGAVLNTNNPVIISPKDVDVVYDAIKSMMEVDPTLQEYNKLVDEMNTIMQNRLDKDKTVYRGTTLDEIFTILENQGMVGLHTERDYAAADDFISTTLYEGMAEEFTESRHDPVVIEFDVSNLPKDDYALNKYEYRPDIYVFDEDDPLRYSYRPGEKFGGTHSAKFIEEAEVRLKSDVTPIIKRLKFLAESPPNLTNNARKLIRELEKKQGSEIIITDSEGNPIDKELKE